MTLLTNDRAQALQVGAVLLFGILVILFAVWQAFVIPEQNAEIEFNHNQDVQDQMLELHGTVMATTGSDTPQSTSVKLGTDFPSRLMFVNPSASTGTLETTDPTDVTIANANALELDGEPFWDGSERAYTTRGIEYNADYRLFDGAPRTVYDSGVLYNAFSSQAAASPRSGQSVIRGNTISLVMVDGEYWETGSRTIEPSFDPVSTQTKTVRVESDGEPITITLQSEMGADTWENDILASENNVEEVNDIGSDLIEIVLSESGEPYNLKLSKVGLGTGVESPAPAYLNEVDGGDETVLRGEPHTVTIDVRDRFNKPMSGITVEGTVVEGDGRFFDPAEFGTGDTVQLDTNSNGQANFQFEPTTVGDITLEFEAVNAEEFTEDGVDTITVNLDSSLSDGAAGGGDDGISSINPPDIRLVEAAAPSSNNQHLVNLAFERTDSGGPVLTLNELRLSFIDLPRSASSPATGFKYRYGDDHGGDYEKTEVDGGYIALPSDWRTVDQGPSLAPPPGANTDDDVTLAFDQSLGQNELLMLSTRWVGDNDVTRTKTYFFAVGDGPFEGFDDENGGNLVINSLTAEESNAGGSNREVEVSWDVEATGGSELDEIQIDVSGDIEGQETIDVSGQQSNSGSRTYTATVQGNADGSVELTVTAADGEQISQTVNY